jgi:hypothetical protein
VTAFLGLVIVLVAVGFAFWTARESLVQRRDGRFDRILDCLVDYCSLLVQPSDDSSEDRRINGAAVSRLRLKAAIEAARVELPVCRKLADDDGVGVGSSPGYVTYVVEKALEEVSEHLHHHRATVHWHQPE